MIAVLGNDFWTGCRADLTRAEYRELRTKAFHDAGMTVGLHRKSQFDAEHLADVRRAVGLHQNIHVENYSEYRQYIPGLRLYSFNGNLAVYDSSKLNQRLPGPAELHCARVASSDAIERKRTRKRLEGKCSTEA